MVSKVSNKSGRDLPKWVAISLLPFFVIVALSILIVIPFIIPFVVIKGVRGDRRLRHQLRRSGRMLDWPIARERLLAKEGILLAEINPKGEQPGRIWWLPEISGPRSIECPLPSFMSVVEDLGAGWSRLCDPDVSTWCLEQLPRYFVEEASLVQVSRRGPQLPWTELPIELVRGISWQAIERLRGEDGTLRNPERLTADWSLD